MEAFLGLTTWAATIAVAFFAGVQLRRERNRRMEIERGANARVSSLAYLLRRQLRAWLGPDPTDWEDFLEEWLRDSQNAGSYAPQVDRAEQLLVEILDMATEASSDCASLTQDAAVHFFAGTDRLNGYAATPNPGGGASLDWLQLRTDAAKDLRGCVAIMEGLIEPGLLDAERLLEQKRAREGLYLEDEES